jgi:ribonuclease HI
MFYFISPDGENTMLTCRLEFQSTNNTTEYEALIQGLNKGINMNVQDILVFSDSEIIIK